MNSLISHLLIYLAASFPAPPKTVSGQVPNRPNIIFILADDLGRNDLGFMGNTYHETPNIDRLSKEGMVFTNAYANAPNCSPTRACLMSGWYTPRHGIYTVGNSDRGKTEHRKLIPVTNNNVLKSSVFTLPEALKAGGYATAIFGKWHLGMEAGSSPLEQGFDVNVGGNSMGKPPAYFSPYKNPQINDGPEGEELTDRLTREAINFIKEHKNSPFFVYLPYYAVHVPLQAKEALIAKYKKKTSPYERSDATYAAMLDNLDQNIGKLLESVKASGLEKNTVVVFFSDNGPYFPVTSAAPLRGSKGMLYEGGIKVPMIVKWPGKIKAGSENNVPVISTDFYPTLLKITNTPKPADKILDGEDLSPLLFGNGKFKRDKLYWHFPAYLERYDGMTRLWRATPSSAIRSGDWKLIEYFEDGKTELFNLKEDISEAHDLSSANPGKVKALQEDLSQWRKELNAPVPTQRNPEFKSNL